MTATATPPAAVPAGPLSLLGRLVAGVADDTVVDAALAELAGADRPVSLPGLCNVLWFGRGDLGGYDGPAFDRYTRVRTLCAHEPDGREPAATAQAAVPLGAIVAVTVGGEEGWGEVVWKEGAHPAVGSDWVPGWLAGAPTGAGDDGPPDPAFERSGPAVLRERVVLDFDGCFGAELTPAEDLAKARRKQRQLDCHGHLVARFAYPAGLDEADEVGFWAAWTVGRHPEALAAAGVPADAALLGEAASVLAAALEARPEVRSFGPYLIDAGLYADVVASDADADGPIGRAVRGLRWVARHEQVSWASMSARLAAEAGPGTLIGTDWPLAVVCASLLALDTLAADAADGDWGGVHLRLDDAWQGGGLWRVERLDATTPVAADPSLALGLGWVAHTGGAIDRVAPADGGPADDGKDDGEDDLDWEVTDSAVTWVSHLSPGDLDGDRLRVPPKVADAIAACLHSAGQDQILVRFHHDGDRTRHEFSRLADSALTVVWPLGVWPGTTVRVTWPPASTVVTATTTLLAVPEQVGDISYTHEFNMAVVLAAAGLADRPERTTTLAQLVRAVIRRYGVPTDDGLVALEFDQVVLYCFGPDGEVAPGYSADVRVAAVRRAVTAMVAAGSATFDGQTVRVAERATGAGRHADAALLARFVAAHIRRLRHAAHKHFVPATVVNLPAGRRRSADKDASYAEVAGTDRLPAGGLAPGQTWRRRHTRGQGLDPALAAALERTKEAIRALGGDETVTAALDNAVAGAEPPAHGGGQSGGTR